MLAPAVTLRAVNSNLYINKVSENFSSSKVKFKEEQNASILSHKTTNWRKERPKGKVWNRDNSNEKCFSLKCSSRLYSFACFILFGIIFLDFIWYSINQNNNKTPQLRLSIVFFQYKNTMNMYCRSFGFKLKQLSINFEIQKCDIKWICF